MKNMESKSRRVTMTLPPEKMELLCKIAEASNKLPGDMAKEIVLETLDGIISMYGLENGKSDIATSDQAIKRMFKVTLAKMLDAIEEIDGHGQ